jgi:hypothetical protein
MKKNNLEIDRDLVRVIEDITKQEQPTYPRVIEDKVMEEGYSRDEIRETLKSLRLSGYIVVSEGRKGQLRLEKRYSEE